MMLHRHFENEKKKAETITTLNDSAFDPFDSPLDAANENDEPFETTRDDYQPRRGRRRKVD